MLRQLLNPSLDDVVFSLKTFAAAVLALLICYAFDLQGPQWAFTSVYIIANPLAGASGSKALYRFIGTAVGGAATVVFVPNLVNAPEILILAVSLWVAGCLMLSLIDRTPRSYTFMLAGYTAALTSFPIVDVPETAFTYATARTMEIGIAIICVLFFNTLFFPKSAQAILTRRMDGWLGSIRTLTLDVLRKDAAEDMLRPLAAKLAAEATDIRMFSTHAFYDTPEARRSAHLSRELHEMMIALLPIISGIQDALAAIRKSGDGMTEEIRQLLAEVANWMEADKAMPESWRHPIWDHLDQIARAGSAQGTWSGAIRRNLAIRLQDLMQTWSDCIDLHNGREPGRTRSRLQSRLGLVGPRWSKHQDYLMVLFSGATVALTVIVGCIIWIATGWSYGSGMVLMSTIIMCFFAAMDNARPIIRTFIAATTFTAAISFVIQFAILPLTDSFLVMATVLACVCIPVGILVAKPQTFLLGMAVGTSLPNMLGVPAVPTYDAAAFLNSNFAMIAGMMLALTATVLIKTVGAEWSASRLLRAGWADIRDAARADAKSDVTELLHRMLDRLGLLAPRMNALSPSSNIHGEDILKDLRAGFNLVELRRCVSDLRPAEKNAVEQVIRELAGHYERKLNKSDTAAPDTSLLEAIDATLDLLRHGKTAEAEQCARASSALRYNLFPSAADFVPASSDRAGERAA